VAQWFGTCTADAMEERIGASTADTLEVTSAA
jgi:hypothetical protein